MIVALEPMLTSIADRRRAPHILAAFCRPAGFECIVDEHHAMRDEALLADCDELADERVRLHARARSDRDVALDLDERADEDVVADRCSRRGWRARRL